MKVIVSVSVSVVVCAQGFTVTQLATGGRGEFRLRAWAMDGGRCQPADGRVHRLCSSPCKEWLESS